MRGKAHRYPLIGIPGYVALTHFVETLNLLGDENRIRLCALLRERELCVTDASGCVVGLLDEAEIQGVYHEVTRASGVR